MCHALNVAKFFYQKYGIVICIIGHFHRGWEDAIEGPKQHTK